MSEVPWEGRRGLLCMNREYLWRHIPLSGRRLYTIDVLQTPKGETTPDKVCTPISWSVRAKLMSSRTTVVGRSPLGSERLLCVRGPVRTSITTDTRQANVGSVFCGHISALRCCGAA